MTRRIGALAATTVVALAAIGVLGFLGACGAFPSTESGEAEAFDLATLGLSEVVEPDCLMPPDPVTLVDDEGLVLKMWTFPFREIYSRPVLPNDLEFLAYRATLRSEGADERHPELLLPPARNEAESALWRDESFNNDLAYVGEVGSIDPITCLDALLFAEQNARVPQLERPTEFLASVLRRRIEGQDRLVVVFGAGLEMFPPSSVYGLEVVDQHVEQGWRYWYLLHNHTRQADGALGVPVPSTSDVRFARSLAEARGLERVRVTNGFYTFDAGIGEVTGFRSR